MSRWALGAILLVLLAIAIVLGVRFGAVSFATGDVLGALGNGLIRLVPEWVIGDRLRWSSAQRASKSHPSHLRVSVSVEVFELVRGHVGYVALFSDGPFGFLYQRARRRIGTHG